MKFLLILWLSKLAAAAVNLIDKRRGSNYAGKLATRLMPGFVAGFRGIDYDKVIFITGTNGKSTTTNLVNHTLKTAGRTVACNVEGANMMAGVATALIKNSTLGGRLNKEFLVLEIDERSLPAIRKVLPARHMGITNLEKDQVQRNGDPDFILRKFEQAIGKDMTLYLNNEEPRSKALEDRAGGAVYFSVAENERTFRREGPWHVTQPCVKCGHPIAFRYYNMASIGPFACTRCGHRSGDAPEVLIEAVDFDGHTFRCGGTDFHATYNEPFYIYNYAMDIAICRGFGLTDEELRRGFETFVNPAIHVTEYTYLGKEVRYLRGKQENPEALQSQLERIAADGRKKAVFVGMHVVSDFLPYYAGSFYFFDCDFAPVAESGAVAFVAFSAAVAGDLASRMLFAGVPEERLTVLDTDDMDVVAAKLEELDVEVAYFLTNTHSVKRLNEYFISHGGTRHE